MATWVTDRAGDKLVQQINSIAPNRRKDSDGTIGDPAHQARDSAHNPEDSANADAPGNPDEQVDARDVTHDPANGCDIGVFWEQIRDSGDMRARHAIFNRRQFSNRAVGGVPAFTWRPYSGENPHDRHGHIEIDDRYHDQVHAWQIGADDMATAKEVWNWDLADDIGGVVKVDKAYVVLNRAEAQSAQAVALGKANAAALAELKARPPVQAAPVDPAMLKAALLDPDFLAAVAKAVVDEDHRRSAA